MDGWMVTDGDGMALLADMVRTGRMMMTDDSGGGKSDKQAQLTLALAQASLRQCDGDG